MKRHLGVRLLHNMDTRKQPTTSQPDKDLAAEERPVPSQAEGDLETVEEDLEEKEKQSPSPKKQ